MGSQRKNRLATRIAVVAMAVTVAMAGLAAPAQAVVVDGGVVTDSVYLSRSETRDVARYLGIDSAAGAGTAAAVLAGCAKLGKMHWVAGAACVTSAAVYGRNFVNATNTAVKRDRCLRVRYSKPGVSPNGVPVIVGFSDNGGRHCRN